ncbi:IS3 family transposase (plasmid) [Embleya sp. NBC_00888]|nr:IS3 family transposase [Embleya sp. NBC_00888]
MNEIGTPREVWVLAVDGETVLLWPPGPEDRGGVLAMHRAMSADLGAEPVLRELHIPTSTYHRRRRSVEVLCERRRFDLELTARITAIHAGSDHTYGSPRVHATLAREGVRVGRKRVERLMREAGLQGISPNRRPEGFTRRDPAAGLAPDLVRRDFTARVPNRLWDTDLTMIPTGEGPLWLAAIRDAFSRRVVAWETSARADADLVLTVLEYALHGRDVTPGTLVHHADHGCQQAVHVDQTDNAPSVRRSCRLDGFGGRLLRQRPRRESAERHQDRMHPWQGRRDLCRGQPRALRLHRRLVQPQTHAKGSGMAQSGRIRGEALRRTSDGQSGNHQTPQPALTS